MTMPHLMNCPHQGDGWCLACVREMRDELKRKDQQLVDYQRALDSRRDHVYVDVTPDAELPYRILAAYIDEQTSTVSEPAVLGEMMNQWQRERNVILRKALADLARGASHE